MRPLHLAVVLVTLGLVGCGDATAGESPAGTPPPPTHEVATAGESPAEVSSPPAHDVAIVIPEAEDGRVAAGTIVEVVYPGGESRGHRHFLQRWDGLTWSDVYQVAISDPDQPYDRKIIEDAWALTDEEFPLPDIGFVGSEGGQFTVIPTPTEPGTYRICNEHRTLCSAAFDVTS
jgi:hypothetical protein